MKRLAYCLFTITGLTLLAGCGEVKRKVQEEVSGAGRHALDSAAAKGHEASSEVIDGAVDSATKKKDSDDAKNRNALKGGSKDDPDQ